MISGLPKTPQFMEPKTIKIPVEYPQEMADRLRDDEPIYDEDYIGGSDD
ncbi:MAG: hypothetical protein V3U54_07765 [Thermodesulfobacteriota bacterium]